MFSSRPVIKREPAAKVVATQIENVFYDVSAHELKELRNVLVHENFRNEESEHVKEELDRFTEVKKCVQDIVGVASWNDAGSESRNKSDGMVSRKFGKVRDSLEE